MKTVLASTFPSLSPEQSGLIPSTHNGATASVGAESSPFIHLGAAAIAGIVTSTATNPIWGEIIHALAANAKAVANLRFRCSRQDPSSARSETQGKQSTSCRFFVIFRSESSRIRPQTRHSRRARARCGSEQAGSRLADDERYPEQRRNQGNVQGNECQLSRSI